MGRKERATTRTATRTKRRGAHGLDRPRAPRVRHRRWQPPV